MPKNLIHLSELGNGGHLSRRQVEFLSAAEAFYCGTCLMCVWVKVWADAANARAKPFTKANKVEYFRWLSVPLFCLSLIIIYLNGILQFWPATEPFSRFGIFSCADSRSISRECAPCDFYFERYALRYTSLRRPREHTRCVLCALQSYAREIESENVCPRSIFLVRSSLNIMMISYLIIH